MAAANIIKSGDITRTKNVMHIQAEIIDVNDCLIQPMELLYEGATIEELSSLAMRNPLVASMLIGIGICVPLWHLN